jgi:hypothetical protein
LQLTRGRGGGERGSADKKRGVESVASDKREGRRREKFS